MNALVEQFEKYGYILDVNEDRIVARCDRVAPRARLGYKNEFNYKFGSVERMYEYVSNFIAKEIEYRQRREEEKARKKAKAVEMANNVKVGDIFIDSWGYEQTNVDFFQVVAKPSAKTIVIREIACETEKGSEMSHGMADNVRPVRDAFIGPEMKKRIDNYGGFKTSSYSCARPADEGRSYYRSWYA